MGHSMTNSTQVSKEHGNVITVQHQLYILTISLTTVFLCCVFIIIYISVNINWLKKNLDRRKCLNSLNRQVSIAFKNHDDKSNEGVLSKNTESSPQQYKEVHKRVNEEFIGRLNEIIYERFKEMNNNEDSESKSTESTLNIEELSSNSIMSEEET